MLRRIPNCCALRVLPRFRTEVDQRASLIDSSLGIAASILLCAMLLTSQKAAADVSEDWHTWGAIVSNGPLGGDDSRYRFWLEGQGRFDDDTSRLNQGLLRGALGYSVLPRTELWAGYAFVTTNRVGSSDDIVEHRYWQQLTWRAAAPWVGFSLSSRTRVEQRTVERAQDTGWRFREFVKLTRPLVIDNSLYLAAWGEVFLNVNSTDWGADDGFDQSRAFIGLGARIAPHLRTEIGYMNQYISRDRRPDASNHVLSLTVFLDF
ncbi:MAG: DUF2490 domain-containing protein [Proteobacteria bacterium]|jgi:hypothetical protein|nr:DUF2490 domain-containing protein [Pseudomonadota bacterium]